MGWYEVCRRGGLDTYYRPQLQRTEAIDKPHTREFLNWVAQTYGEKVIVQLNAAAREGKYRDVLWKDWTGKTVQELGYEWKKMNEDRLQPAREPNAVSKSF